MLRRSAGRIYVVCALIVLIVGAFLFVYPTRSLLAQQRQFDAKRREVAAIERENVLLQAESNRLALPSEIERVAREQFNMVRKNEQAFSVVLRHQKKPATANG